MNFLAGFLPTHFSFLVSYIFVVDCRMNYELCAHYSKDVL